MDDPFRSLAGELRRAGGFAKDTTPFSEFLWPDFLRRQMSRKLGGEPVAKRGGTDGEAATPSSAKTNVLNRPAEPASGRAGVPQKISGGVFACGGLAASLIFPNRT